MSRKRFWLVYVLILAIILLFVLSIWLAKGYAASPAYCQSFAQAFDRTLKTAVDDPDFEGFLHDRAYSRCLNRDEDPKFVPLPDNVTTKDEGIASATADDPHAIACKKYYRTYRVSDDTVIRRGNKGKRVPCPL